MKLALFALCVLLPGCSTITCNFTGDNNHLTIEQPKTISTIPSVTASGNTVPIAP